jgi:hypothetical protein
MARDGDVILPGRALGEDRRQDRDKWGRWRKGFKNVGISPRLAISFTPEQLDWLQRRAERAGTSQSAVVRACVDAGIGNKKVRWIIKRIKGGMVR